MADSHIHYFEIVFKPESLSKAHENLDLFGWYT